MRTILTAALLLLAPAASAHEVKAGSVTIVHPLMRASLGQAPNTAVYMTLRNAAAQPDRLLSAQCACARKVEAHLMAADAGRMVMRPAGPVSVPARGELAFKPGGAHLMVLGLKAPAEAGTTVPVVLTFERAGEVTVPVFVTARIEQELNAHGAPAHHH
jgi:copper(I)-binding protein